MRRFSYNSLKIFRARVDKQGSDSIQATQRRQNKIDGVREDIVLVDEEELPFIPDREVLRKTEILGMGVRSSYRKKPEKPGEDDDDGN
jgi:hypothetical protein